MFSEQTKGWWVALITQIMCYIISLVFVIICTFLSLSTYAYLVYLLTASQILYILMTGGAIVRCIIMIRARVFSGISIMMYLFSSLALIMLFSYGVTSGAFDRTPNPEAETWRTSFSRIFIVFEVIYVAFSNFLIGAFCFMVLKQKKQESLEEQHQALEEDDELEGNHPHDGIDPNFIIHDSPNDRTLEQTLEQE
jgi:hypothetical protein